ncbi:MAG TPA: sensor histidine kinase [Caulobacteraceae bacterium]|jgi:signal transduction histidine kinase|nr:sensor histidine kinase [Caulobacteraceae bacterium]
MECIAANLDARFAPPGHGATRPGIAIACQSAVTALRRLPAPTDQAVIAERQRIARELHDTLAQGFAAIRLQIELARADSGLPPQAMRALDLAYQIAGENLVETRRSMAALKSVQPSLETSLSAAIEGVRRLGQVEVIAEVGPVFAPPGEVSHELLRIAQEAMLNAARHAEARTLRVSLTPLPGGLRLAIIDDGKGFDPAKTSSGFGLEGLRERAAEIDAELSITSAPGFGAQILVTWLSPQMTAAAA